MFAGPPLDYRRWTTIGSPSRTPSPCQDAQGPGPLRFAPSSRKHAALDGIFLSRLFFQFLHTDGSWFSVQAYNFLVLLRTSERLGILFYWSYRTPYHELATFQPHQKATA